MAINDADIIRILVYQTSEERGNRSTARSLKITVLYNRQQRIFRSNRIILLPLNGGPGNRSRRYDPIGGRSIIGRCPCRCFIFTIVIRSGTVGR